VTTMILPVLSLTVGADEPILTSADVGKLIVSDFNPDGVSAKTVGVYRALSKGNGRYAAHPFPEPAGFHGDRPYWVPDQIDDIKAWAAARPGRGSGATGRPRKAQ
jgi:hypothetical protein